MRQKNSKKTLFIYELLILIAVYFSLYLFTIARNFSAAHDSITNINQIDSGRWYFHVHHLLYVPLTNIWIKCWQICGFTTSSEFLASLLSIIFGVLGLCFFYCFLRKRLGLSFPLAFVGVGLIGFSFGFWFYSVCIEVHIIPISLLTVCIYLITSEHIDNRLFAIVGLIHGVAILFHQVHILFMPVIIIAAILYSNRRLLSFFHLMARYLLTFIPTVVIPYLLVGLYAVKLHSLGDFFNWLMGYTKLSVYWVPFSFSTMAKAILGFGRSILGGHFSFSIADVSNFITNHLGEYYLVDEKFLVRSLNEIMGQALLILSLMLFFIIASTFFYRLRYLHLLWPKRGKIIILFSSWFIIYTIFFFFWNPENVKFWIPQSLCFWMLYVILFCGHTGLKSEFRNAVGMFLNLFTIALLLFTINFMGSMKWLKHQENDYYYKKISILNEEANQDDLVIIGRSWIIEAYLKRYTNSKMLSLSTEYLKKGGANREAINGIKKSIDKTLNSGNKVIISQEAVNFEPALIKYYGHEIKNFETLWKNYESKWREIGTVDNKFYLLQEKNR